MYTRENASVPLINGKFQLTSPVFLIVFLKVPNGKFDKGASFCVDLILHRVSFKTKVMGRGAWGDPKHLGKGPKKCDIMPHPE